MRTWLGLILKIMVRTKSYILSELCYLTKSIGNARNYNSFQGLSPVVPFYHLKEGSFCIIPLRDISMKGLHL